MQGDDIFASNTVELFSLSKVTITNPKAMLSIYAGYVNLKFSEVSMSRIGT